MCPLLNRAVFLDRDGTINEEICYLGDPSQVRFIDGVPAAIAALNKAGFKVVVFTNQAGVARGYFSETAVNRVHSAIEASLGAQGARIDAFYSCPHHPTEGVGPYRVGCECRKPKPGLLEKARRDLRIDMCSSFVVGDKLSDLESGLAMHCKVILVRTGYGRESEEKLANHRLRPDYVAADLLEASQWILGQDS